MPWRHDFVQCYWVDPDWGGFSEYPTHAASLESTAQPIGAAVIVVRDRIGFRYERVVGLDDFVSVREAAQLVGLPIMTLSRWIKRRRIRSRKRNGFSVLQLRDVLKAAMEQRRTVRIGSRLKILG